MEKTLMGGQTWMPVNSPSRITPENNGKIRQKPDRENAFVMACGGGNGTEVQPSLVDAALICKEFLNLIPTALSTDLCPST